VTHSMNVCYDRPLVRRALNRFMFDRMGWSLVAGLPVASLFLLLLSLWGTWDTWLTVMSIALAITIGVISYVYILRFKTSDRFFEKAKDPTVKFIFSSEGVKTESEIGTSELKWAVFDELLIFPDVWLLIYARSGYLTLPTKALTEECKVFIKDRMPSSKKAV
jgi:hypothetical protein